MPNSDMKSAISDPHAPPSATGGQAGMNGGVMKSGTDAQYIKTVAFRDMGGKPATVDGSFREMFKNESPGTGPASASPRPGSEIFSAQECDHGKLSGY